MFHRLSRSNNDYYQANNDGRTNNSRVYNWHENDFIKNINLNCISTNNNADTKINNYQYVATSGYDLNIDRNTRIVDLKFIAEKLIIFFNERH